jgi:hypothetical protein
MIDINIEDLLPTDEEIIRKKITFKGSGFALVLLFLENEFVKREAEYVFLPYLRKKTGLSFSYICRILDDMNELNLIKMVRLSRMTEIYPIKNDEKNALTHYKELAYISLTGTTGKVDELIDKKSKK